MHFAVPSLFMALTLGQQPVESHQTANFVIRADSLETARQIGAAAEQHRKTLAKLWLGGVLPDWTTPCRIDVAASTKNGGYTQISYANGKVAFQRINLEGSLDRLLQGPLPHELTHVLFAHYFGFQAPRWADEGGAILSEGELKGAAHRRVFRTIIDNRRAFPLRDFFALRDYPADIPCLYAQGHSIASFLVAAKGHQAFLSFVRDGLDRSWDEAVNDRYGYKSVDQLEKAWLDWVGKQQAEKGESIPLPMQGVPGSRLLDQSSHDAWAFSSSFSSTQSSKRIVTCLEMPDSCIVMP
jgi:hypothetical protein